MRKRRRKRIALTERLPLLLPSQPNHAWSVDFIHDALADGRRIRCLNVVDDFTKESVVIEVDTSISGLRVARVLDRIAEHLPLPNMIRVDHGQLQASVHAIAPNLLDRQFEATAPNQKWAADFTYVWTGEG